MLLWQAKTSSSGTYTNMKTPSYFKISLEDLDNKSYRSINTGNLNRTIVSKAWTKIQMSYNCLTESEVNTLLTTLKAYPLYVKVKHPMFGTDYVEMEMYCSKKEAEMLETRDYTVSFSLVQSKKVSGQ